MTGKAESQRKVKPDPAQPSTLQRQFRGNQQRTAKGTTSQTGWHYQRQLTLKSDSSTPDGKRFVTFHNTDPGRGCHALARLRRRWPRSLLARASLLGARRKHSPRRRLDELPRIIVTFYDDRRATVGEESVGKFEGTFAWRRGIPAACACRSKRAKPSSASAFWAPSANYRSTVFRLAVPTASK